MCVVLFVELGNDLPLLFLFFSLVFYLCIFGVFVFVFGPRAGCGGQGWSLMHRLHGRDTVSGYFYDPQSPDSLIGLLASYGEEKLCSDKCLVWSGKG